MLEKDDIQQLKEIFVSRQECEGKMNTLDDKIAQNGLELATIKQQVSTISWVSKTTLGAVLTAVIGAIMLVVLK